MLTRFPTLISYASTPGLATHTPAYCMMRSHSLLMTSLNYIPAVHTDLLLHSIVITGLIAWVNAFLVTLGYVAVSTVALGLDGEAGTRAACTFARVRNIPLRVGAQHPLIPLDHQDHSGSC